MTREALRVFLQEHFCGCGDPEAAAETLFHLLRAHDGGAEVRVPEPLWAPGARYLLLYWLDRAGLTDHGTHIMHAWLTPLGAEVREALSREEADGFEALMREHCVHGFDLDFDEHVCLAAPSEPLTPRGLYLDLLKHALIDAFYDPGDPVQRAEGRECWPARGCTMIGLPRLDNLQHCVEDVLAQGVPGDLIETGVWRGGATILLRGVLKAYGITDRRVWVADSFAGLPPPDPARYPIDAGSILHTITQLVVPLEEVQANFAKFGLLDEQVVFLPGWFEHTLTDPRIERLAVLRLDGDLYSSTMQALVALYPKLSPGGYCIIDDFGAVANCRQAVEDFRAAQGIEEAIQPIDWAGVYWQKRA